MKISSPAIMLLRRLLSVTFLFSVLLSSCAMSDEETYENYYYPWTRTQDTVIYVYEDQSMDLGKQYHFMTKVDGDNGMQVVKTVYDDQLDALFTTVEKRISNGFLMKSYSMYRRTDSGFIDTVMAEIKVGQMFYFGKMEEGATLIQHYVLRDIDTAAHDLIILRNSQIMDGEGFMWKNRILPSLLMEIEGEIEDVQVGSVTLELKGRNTYVKGIGCVNFTQVIENTISHNYLYQGKIDLDEWKKMHEEKN